MIWFFFYLCLQKPYELVAEGDKGVLMTFYKSPVRIYLKRCVPLWCSPFVKELEMVPTTEQSRILWPWKYLSRPVVLCANCPDVRMSQIDLFFTTIQIIPKAQTHFKAYSTLDLAATIGHLIWVKIPDWDAGKDTAGFLEHDTLAFENALQLYLSEVISQLHWIMGSFTTSFSRARSWPLEWVEIGAITHICNDIAEIRIWPLFSYLVN